MALALIGLCSVASATRLTFNQVNGNVIGTADTTSSPNYGHRVTSTTMGNYSYGAQGGFTPNVTVAYRAQNPAGTFPGLSVWATGYGDMSNVLWSGNSSTAVPNDGYVTLTADAGFQVSLQSFRTALWSTGPANYTDISVRDGLGNLLYSSNAANPVGGSVLHDFTSAPLTAQQLEIKFGQGWWIAVDDVTFSQAVPEPGTMLVLGAGLVALARRRRARS